VIRWLKEVSQYDTPQPYTAAFKREAVRLITEQRYGMAEIARNWGMNVTMLRRGPPAYPANTRGAFPGNGCLTPDQAELR
jgi:transposase